MGTLEHGVESAHYTNGHMGYQPVFVCFCGFGTAYANGSWSDAGAEFDEHLESARAVDAVDPHVGSSSE